MSLMSDDAGSATDHLSSILTGRRQLRLDQLITALIYIIGNVEAKLNDLRRPDTPADAPPRQPAVRTARIKQDHPALLNLATGLGRMARAEINRLDDERPNNPDAKKRNAKQRDLLLIFAEGFEQIAEALGAVAKKPGEPILLGKAAAIVGAVTEQVNGWWRKNQTEAVDWSVRLPFFAGGVSLLGWAGAGMTVATTALAACVIGPKVAAAIPGKKKRK